MYIYILNIYLNIYKYIYTYINMYINQRLKHITWKAQQRIRLLLKVLIQIL